MRLRIRRAITAAATRKAGINISGISGALVLLLPPPEAPLLLVPPVLPVVPPVLLPVLPALMHIVPINPPLGEVWQLSPD